MPTGYTCGVQDGTITDFRDFALQCARAFGANVLMRDEPMDKPIEEYQPSDFYKKRLDEANRMLSTIRAMTDEECENSAQEEYRKAVEYYRSCIIDRYEQKNRYNAMLEHVKAWEPPTPDHANLKEFMEGQLKDSIDHDCRTAYLTIPVKKNGKQWRAEQIERLERTIPSYRKSYQEEIDRTNDRNEWNRKLIESLKEFQTT